MKSFPCSQLSLLAAGTIGVLLLTGGCASTGDTDESAMALTCPKCETVWVRHKNFYSKIQSFHVKPDMVCPTCDKNARAYLDSDGKLVLHNCPDCKVTPRVAKPKRKMSHLGHKHR